VIDRILGSELAMAVLLVAVPYLLARLLGWLGRKAAELRDERIDVAMNALEQGVHDAWGVFGRKWKAAHSDGKFTDDERVRLRVVALENAKAVGLEQGVNVAKELGRFGLNLLIKKIVDRRKANAEA